MSNAQRTKTTIEQMTTRMLSMDVTVSGLEKIGVLVVVPRHETKPGTPPRRPGKIPDLT